MTTTHDAVIERVFNAPRELVWKAWTDPEQVMRWWGPKAWTSPIAKIDLRVGGKYLFSMKTTEGEIYYSTGTYQEVTPMDKLVFTDSFSDESGNIISPTQVGMSENFPEVLLITLTFEDVPNGTRMTLRHSGMPVGGEREMTEAGWQESLDKLEATLR